MGRPYKTKDDEEKLKSDSEPKPTPRAGIDGEKSQHDNAPANTQLEVAVAVVEQRVSNLAQGALCLVLLTGPFLYVLHLIPRGMHYIPYSLPV